MVFARCQTIQDAGQFQGDALGGLWGFSDWNNIPRTSRLVILSISYYEPAAPVGLTVNIWASRPGGLPTERMPIAYGLADPAQGGKLINPITNAGELRACGITLPRDLPSGLGDGGQHWQIHLQTTGKAQTATACCDWAICPYPDTTPEDSRDR